ncbi:phosphotransferase [Rhodococcoides fascians A25f]|uniref:phosphotransferase n=1 Tax=Rhodococcoides fascians TaxID=1828 RepID=UPI0006912967|nr:phosphotransferase [Rhodococcus fascians]QII04883.1 phosphotransferase [Rhodococcus fascians A25f]
MKYETEMPLSGGNSTVVHRVAETVRRVTGDHSSAVHSLLKELERKGYPYAPRFLGVDGQGREILTYRHGTAGNYPMPAAIRSVEALESAVRILRRLHDLTIGVQLPDGHARHLPDGVDPEVICHWDAAPYNFVFEGSTAVALIDFDEAGPGRRIDDLAYFAYRFAPLCSADNFSDGGWSPDTDRWDRLRRIFTIYPDPRTAELPDIVIARLAAMKNATSGGLAHAHGALYTRDQLFIDQNRNNIAEAVCSAKKAVAGYDGTASLSD